MGTRDKLTACQIRKDKTIACDSFSYADIYGFAEHRASVDKAVKLAVFAAGVDSCRQVFEKGGIKIAARKAAG